MYPCSVGYRATRDTRTRPIYGRLPARTLKHDSSSAAVVGTPASPRVVFCVSSVVSGYAPKMMSVVHGLQDSEHDSTFQRRLSDLSEPHDANDMEEKHNFTRVSQFLAT